MDQFTRRTVCFAVHRGVVDGVALCGMFNRAIHAQTLPKYLSSDHDPLYRFHQWQANLRVLDVQEIKAVLTFRYRIRCFIRNCVADLLPVNKSLIQ
jgi:hypothetical protein